MDYLLSKVLTQLALPLGMGGLLVVTGALTSLFGGRRVGTGLSLFGLAWIWLWATPVFSDRVRGSLEGLYAPGELTAIPQADVIVVLGGGVEGPAPPRLFPNLHDAADRVWHGARLYHAGKAPLVVISGGGLPWTEEQGPEAKAMAVFLRDLGVPRERMLLEGRSATTYENARETKKLLAVKAIDRVLLVTSAMHMRRAEATFQKAGISVVPVPTDFEVETQPVRTWLDYLPDAEALESSSKALKEYLGLWVYRWKGWA